MITDVEIISVNYNTPELIYRQYYSIRKYISSDIKIRIIDGSDKNIHKFKDLIEQDKNFSVDFFGMNIHHGKGMDYGIKSSKYKYLLILDSDVYIIKNDLLTTMLNEYSDGVYGVGNVSQINLDGINVDSGIDYLHPRCMLIKKQTYLKYKPFKNHGAPCIDTMFQLNQKRIPLKHISTLNEYIFTEGRGTVTKNHGYNIPNASQNRKIDNIINKKLNEIN